MPLTIERQTVMSLVNEGAQLVDVLTAQEYEQEHLPGAINIPLKN
jgi:rhodanese-related sulfurtransferase